MKKSIYALIFAFIALIASGVALGVVVTNSGQSDQPVLSDSVLVAPQTGNIEPVFTTKGDVLGYYELEWNKRIVDSVFFNMPYNVLENVAAVVTARQPECSKKDIALEYLKNSNIYKYLDEPADDTPPDISTEAMLLNDSTGPHDTQHDTIIDGVKYKKIE